MTRTQDVPRGASARVGRARPTAPRFLQRWRSEPPPERAVLLGASLLAVGLFGLSFPLGSLWAPPGLQIAPLLLGGLLLSRSGYRRLAALVTVLLVAQFLAQSTGVVPPGAAVVVLIAGLVGAEFARSREETGFGGSRGETLLVELRQRLVQQGALPTLPAPWNGDEAVNPAGGGAFAGDFVVSTLTPDQFEVALVDVSGKGVDAGTRALLLSGALGGLLGALAPEQFLKASNDYLVRQNWEEGFATAVHLAVDLATGAFTVGSAGHPPAAHYDAGSGRWSLIECHGPALGLLAEIDFTPYSGVLRPGDAVLLYTDGLVEVPGRDLSVGIDKLLGEAERMVTRGFAGGAQQLISDVAADSSDDRGIVLFWRSAH